MEINLELSKNETIVVEIDDKLLQGKEVIRAVQHTFNLNRNVYILDLKDEKGIESSCIYYPQTQKIGEEFDSCKIGSTYSLQNTEEDNDFARLILVVRNKKVGILDLVTEGIVIDPETEDLSKYITTCWMGPKLFLRYPSKDKGRVVANSTYLSLEKDGLEAYEKVIKYVATVKIKEASCDQEILEAVEKFRSEVSILIQERNKHVQREIDKKKFKEAKEKAIAGLDGYILENHLEEEVEIEEVVTND